MTSKPENLTDIDLEQFLNHESSLGQCLVKHQFDDEVIEVRQNDSLTWIYTGEQAVQSMMLNHRPWQLLMPNQFAMLQPLQVINDNAKHLNLGFGCGGIERFCFHHFPTLNTTSVEIDALYVELAHQYFNIKADHTVIIEDAFDFVIENTGGKYDFISIDIFEDNSNAPCIYDNDFYKALKLCLNKDAVISINLILEDEEDLLEILDACKSEFAYIDYIDIGNCANSVLWLSQAPLLKITNTNFISCLDFNYPHTQTSLQSK